MKKILNYFLYEFASRSLWSLIGESPDQIIDTLKYYKYYRSKNSKEEKQVYGQFIIPSCKKIKAIKGNVEISIEFPLGHKDQYIDAWVCPNVVLSVNANAVGYVKKIGKNWRKNKRGELYKFMPGISSKGIWFLPESIMRGLSEYNWSSHQKQINEWLNQREEDLDEGVQRGYFCRPFKNINN